MAGIKLEDITFRIPSNTLHLSDIRSDNPYAHGTDYKDVRICSGIEFDRTLSPFVELCATISSGGTENLGSARWLGGFRAGVNVPVISWILRALGAPPHIAGRFRLPLSLQTDLGKSELNMGGGEMPAGAFDWRILGGAEIAYRHTFPSGIGIEVGAGILVGGSPARSYWEFGPAFSLTTIFKKPPKPTEPKPPGCDDCDEEALARRNELHECKEKIPPRFQELSALEERANNLNEAAKALSQHNQAIWTEMKKTWGTKPAFCKSPPPELPAASEVPNVLGLPSPHGRPASCAEEKRIVENKLAECHAWLGQHPQRKAALEKAVQEARERYDAQLNWKILCQPPPPPPKRRHCVDFDTTICKCLKWSVD